MVHCSLYTNIELSFYTVLRNASVSHVNNHMFYINNFIRFAEAFSDNEQISFIPLLFLTAENDVLRVTTGG